MLWRVFFVATLVGFYGLYSGHLSEDISSVAIICGSAVGLYLLIIRPLGRLFFGETLDFSVFLTGSMLD